MGYQLGASDQADDDNKRTSNRRLYNPYQDLNINLPAKSPFNLPTSPEFLFEEESRVERRSWGENITYYTGIGFLGGATAGAAGGFLTGVKAIESTDTLKLKINRILNGSGHSGRRVGNRCGVIGLIYSGMENGVVALRDKDDAINSVVAGLGTGALYKAAAGPRSAAVAGAIGGVLAGVAVAGKQVMKRYIPI